MRTFGIRQPSMFGSMMALVMFSVVTLFSGKSVAQKSRAGFQSARRKPGNMAAGASPQLSPAVPWKKGYWARRKRSKGPGAKDVRTPQLRRRTKAEQLRYDWHVENRRPRIALKKGEVRMSRSGNTKGYSMRVSALPSSAAYHRGVRVASVRRIEGDYGEGVEIRVTRDREEQRLYLRHTEYLEPKNKPGVTVASYRRKTRFGYVLIDVGRRLGYQHEGKLVRYDEFYE